MAADPRAEIRARLDLADLISEFVRLQKAGQLYRGLCPFHDEKTPSFFVRPDKGLWHCYGCGEHGDGFSFIMKMQGLSFPEALELLAEKTGVQLDKERFRAKPGETDEIYQALATANRFFRQSLDASSNAKQYLAKRKIDGATADEFEIGFAPPGWENLVSFFNAQKVNLEAAAKAGLVARRNSGGFYDRFRFRLMFPVKDPSGRLVGFGGRDLGQEGPKYLNSPETPVFHKGSILYGLGLARKDITTSGTAVVVEGYLDVISAHRTGVRNVVATMGTALGPGHAQLLKRFCERVVVCYDSDQAGKKAALGAADILEVEGFDIRVAVLPVGEDPDSLVNSGRADELIKAVESACGAGEYRLDVLMSGYRLGEEPERARMLNKAVQLLARMPNVFERDRLIRKLAPYHPMHASNPVLAEERIRKEVDKLTGTEKKKDIRAFKRNTANTDMAPRASNRLEQAERSLVRALMTDSDMAAYVCDRVSVDLFSIPEARAIASELITRLKLGETDYLGTSVVMEFLEDLADSRVSQMASELMVADSGPPLTQKWLDDCIQLLQDEQRRPELETLKEKVRKGELGQNDPDFLKYQSLVREKHGI